MRTIVIGDIHGCYNELVDMIEELETDGKYNKDTDRLIFLGDYIDRGKDSNKVVKYIRELQRKNDNVIALMGNHEDMCIEYFKNQFHKDWLYNGGYTTIESYDDERQLMSDVMWMKTLPLYYEDEHFIYVHAGVNTYKPLIEQSRTNLLWIREAFIHSVTAYDKRVIFGHTPSLLMNGDTKPYCTQTGNVGIDTGCVFGGCLTALIIEDDKIDGFYQIDKEEETEGQTIYRMN